MSNDPHHHEPLTGCNYLYLGPLKSHYGRVGVVSNVRKAGRYWLLNLANHKEWLAEELEPVLYDVLSTEVVPCPAEPASTPRSPLSSTPRSAPAQDPNPAIPAFEGGESEMVQDCLTWLEENDLVGWVVGQRNAKGSGTTVGYPDLSIRASWWPRGFAVLVELKNAEGTLSKEQEDIHGDGGSFVVRSVAELEQVAARVCALARVMQCAEDLVTLGSGELLGLRK